MSTSSGAAPSLDAVRAELDRVGLDGGRVDTAAYDRLTRFFDLRARWAGTHNLSGPRALAQAWHIDLADGVAVAMASGADRLVDVGAGSGVPGLIVACLAAERRVTLVEPIAKRTAFLRSAARQLGMTMVEVVRGRWPVAVEGPQVVVSRAVVDPAEWPTLAVSAGDGVTGVVRMLAARRPPMELSGFALADAVDYDLGADGARRVERWDRAD